MRTVGRLAMGSSSDLLRRRDGRTGKTSMQFVIRVWPALQESSMEMHPEAGYLFELETDQIVI